MLVGAFAGFVVSKIVEGIDNLAHAADNAKESAESFASSYNSMNDEFSSNDSKLSDLQKQYDELSKGVNSLGENVSLTTDEYDTYKQVISEISDMMPNLLARYDDEGNKIGFVQGKLSDLNAEYDKYKKNKAMDLVNGDNDNGDSIKDVFDNYQYQTAHTDANGNTIGKRKMFGNSNYEKILALQEEIDNGYDGVFGQNKLTNEDIEKKTALIQKYQSEIDASVSAIQDALSAIAQSGDEYYKLSDQEQQFLDTYINSLSQDFIDENNLTNETNARTFINNLINDIESGKPEIMKAYNDLFSFNIDDTDLSPEEVQKKVNELIQQLAKALGEDNWQDLKIRLGFEFVDDNVKDYEDTINRFNDPEKIKDFFDTEGINTSDEIKQFNDLTDGITNADIAIQKWNESKKEVTETPLSFIDLLNESDYEDVRKELVELAKSGELSAETLSSTSEYNELLEKVGVSAQDAKDQILDMLSAQDRLAGATQGLDKLKSAYEEFKDKDIGFVTAETLQSLPDVFKNLPDFDLFSKIVGNPESGKEKIQQAFNDIVKSYLADQETLQGLVGADQSTIQTYIANLKQMGITNAEEVVRTANEVLNSDNKMIDAAEKEYNKYLKGKLKGGEKFLESTTSNNSKLKNALGSTYKSDYDNWCDLLSKKADAYNEFVKAIGGSYDDSKNVAQNLVANNGAFGANEYAEAQAAYDKWKQTKKQADDLKNSLKLDYSQITTDFGANWSPTTKKSKSKTKSDAAEVFDFIEIKLNNLADKASKAKDKIDDLLTFGQKKNQTKKAIEATTKAITAQEKAYKKYIAYANKAAKTQNSKKTSSSSSTSTGGNAVYDTATDYLGLKYVWGGSSLTKGADCSGFTQQIYKKYGVSLPHHAADQAKMGTKITSKKDLQAGDLVFFGSKNNITHVGIYGGDGKFIESPHTGASVRVSKLSSRKDFVSGSRFNGISGSTTTTSSGSNVKKVKGVSSKTLEHYKKLIRNGTLDADGIQTIKNENLKNALKDYQTWYEKAKACKEQVASLKEQLKELYDTLANNPIDKATDKIEKLGTKMDLLNSKVDNAVVTDKKSSITSVNKLYKSIMGNYDSQLSASKTEYTTAKSNFSSSKKSLTNKFNKSSAKKLGLTKSELSTVKKNLKDNKKIPNGVINKIYAKFGYCSLYEKCIAHNEYLDAYRTATDDYRQAKQDNISNKRQAASDQFDKISGGFDNKLSAIEHITNTAQANLDYAEATGHYATQNYYKALLDSNQKTMAEEQAKMDRLTKQRDAFVKSGDIKKGDDAWQKMSEEIWQCAENIQSCKQNTVEYNNALRDLEWDAFDHQEEYLGRISDEANFLIDLMDSKDKFDDNGNITSYGKSIEGLHAVNANVYQSQANDYEKRIKELDEEYKNDQYNKDYLEKRQAWLESQREAIKNCESEKQAIVSLAKEGYESMSNALDELIQKRKDALQSEKDLYDYQKSIASKTKSIASLHKQLEAISGDTSEENKAQIQKLKVSLDDAQTDLRDTEYDKWVSDQGELMDKVSEDFKSWIDSRMKRTDDIVNDVIKQTNASGNEIKDTLTSVTGQYGTALTDKMGEIWDSSNGLNNIVSNMWTGDDGIKNSFTTVNSTLNDIRTYCKTLSEGSLNSFNKPSSDDVLKYVEDAFENKTPRSTTSTSNSSSGNSSTTTTTKNTNILTGIPASRSSKTSSSSSKKDSSSSSNASWASKYLIHKKYTGNKSKLNKNSLVDRLKYFDFDSSMDARKKYYKKLFKGAYSASAAQNTKLIAEMKKHGFKKGGEIGNLVKLTGEDGFVLARKGEGILTPENMETLRESIKISNATLSMINNLTKTPQIKPSNLNNTVNPTVNIGDIQVVANNPQEFAREFRNTVINDPKTQKMLSTFIGNQLTGGNSLEFKKYK